MSLNKIIYDYKFSLLSVFLLSISVKTLAIFFLSIPVTSDALAYWTMSVSLLESGSITDGQGNVAFYSSGYPIFLVPFLGIFGTSLDVVKFVNVFLGGVSSVLLFMCSLKVLKSSKWALLVSVIWLIYPPNILYTEYIAKENLMIPILLLQLYLTLIYNQKLWQSIALGATFGFGMLVGSAIILTVIPIAFVILSSIRWKTKSIKKSLALLFVFLFSSVITMAPWLIYTNSILGKPLLNTNGGFNLYLGNNEKSTPYYMSIADTPIGPKWYEIRKSKGEIDATNHLKLLAINHMIENPVSTVRLSLQKVLHFWMPPFHNGEGHPSILEKTVRKVWLITYLMLLLLALFSFKFAKKMNRELLIVITMLAAYCLIHAVAYIIFRYRIPIMPMLVITSVFTLREIFNYYKNDSQKFLRLTS